MRVLLDECVTRYLKRDLIGHDVSTLQEAGFKGLKNGILLRNASGKYDVFLTVDQNIPFQHNTRTLGIAILIPVAKNNTYVALKPLIPEALRVLDNIQPGQVIRVT